MQEMLSSVTHEEGNLGLSLGSAMNRIYTEPSSEKEM